MNRILVIEDDCFIRENTLEILELERYTVFGAVNGREGIDLARELRPNLILCDLGMPVMDGWEVLQELRADHEIGDMPFIFFTAFSEKLQMQRGLDMGANGYIIKPFYSDDLLKIVRENIRQEAY